MKLINPLSVAIFLVWTVVLLAWGATDSLALGWAFFLVTSVGLAYYFVYQHAYNLEYGDQEEDEIPW